MEPTYFQRIRSERKAAGLCVRCARPAAEGATACPACRDRRRAAQKARTAAKRAEVAAYDRGWRRRKREREAMGLKYNNKPWEAFAREQCLTPWDVVAETWNAISGEPPLTKTRVWQIGTRAEKKLAELLADCEGLCSGRRLPARNR